MKRFLAVVGLVAFVAACSDSNVTSPASHLKPGVASRDAGNPPPPPLSGDGFVDLSVGSSLVPQGAVSTTAPTACGDGFSGNVTFTYDGNNPSYNQVVHAQFTGPDVTGNVDVHQNENGKANAHGHVTDGSFFSFDIQSGDPSAFAGGINAVESDGGIILVFNFDVSGILTNLMTGAKCLASGHLHGEGTIGGPIIG